jgi:hypothetical protein
MKKIILALPFLIACSFNIFPQWSTDPNNNLIVGYGLDPHICSDSAGGCYITYDYNSTAYPRWLGVERLNKYGYKPWGTLIRILGEFPGQSKAEITEDGSGGVIISYEDREESTGWIARIRVQKVDSSGNFLWGPTGVKVTLDEVNQGSQKIVSDGEGGAVVIWVSTLAEYKVNRISSTGERMWGDCGIVLGVNGYHDPAILLRTSNNKYVANAERDTYKYFDENGNIFYTGTVEWLENMISDGNGGIIITNRGGQWPENWQLRAQRKDSLGNSLWQAPYIVVAESLYINTRNKTRNNDGFYFFSWSGMKNGIDDIAQFQALKLDGSKLFSNKDVSINDTLPLSISGIIPSEAGKTIFIWNNDPNLPDTTLTQLYDTLGNKIWNVNGVVVAQPAISYQTFTTDFNGGFIIGGIINEFTVVAQQVSRFGNLGEIITSISRDFQESFPKENILYQNYPNPFNSTTIIKYHIAEQSNVKMSIYNILGEQIKILLEEYKNRGIFSLSFNANDLPSGVYIYILETNNSVLTNKLTIIK